MEDGAGIRTQAFDPSKVVDPSLIIYAPVRVLGDQTIVTNGDQTDTIYDFLAKGGSFSAALETRTFEPDAPNYTPRISGIVRRAAAGMSYELSILKSADGDPQSCRRYTFTYLEPVAGQGHMIHTYSGDGDPLPSFTGEPKTVAIPDDIDAFTDLLWSSLNEENKVSLFVRYIDVASGGVESRTRIKINNGRRNMANELSLKYGCNPNQKPSRIFMKDGSDLPSGTQRQTRLYQLP